MLIIKEAPFWTWSSAGPSSIQISSQIFIPIATSSYQNKWSDSEPLEKYLASSKTE